MDWDAIVVGTGPAGSAAAKELALQGYRVLALERARHPRRKVCGGCLSRRIDRLLGTDFHEVVERRVRDVVFAYKDGRCFHHRSRSAFAYLVRRERFDEFLARDAVRAGVKLRQEETVLDVAEGVSGVKVTTDRATYEAPYLIGADGVASLVARRLGLTGHRQLGLAREADLTWSHDPVADGGEPIKIGLGVVPYGYGWVFPKDGNVSVGVAGERENIGDVKEVYRQFLRDQAGLAHADSTRPAGYFLSTVASNRAPLATARTLLVGDAAGFADPFIGEGIYYAVLSGQRAASVIGSALESGGTDLAAYRRLLERDIFEEFRYARRWAWLFYRYPRWGYYVLEHGDMLESFCDVLRGESSYREVWDGFKGIGGLETLRFWGVLRPAGRNDQKFYDRFAPVYHRFRQGFERTLARGAQAYLADLVRRYVPDGATVLDAGTGTGAAARLVLQVAKPGEVFALDWSAEMLRQARANGSDPRVLWVRGDMRRLPLPDESVDVVVSTWALETLTNPRTAAKEFLRVIKPDGAVIHAFSSLPATGGARFLSYLLEQLADWPFLPPREQPLHHCGRSSMKGFARGLLRVAVLRKCCNVDDPYSPCLPRGHAASQGTMEGLSPCAGTRAFGTAPSG